VSCVMCCLPSFFLSRTPLPMVFDEAAYLNFQLDSTKLPATTISLESVS